MQAPRRRLAMTPVRRAPRATAALLAALAGGGAAHAQVCPLRPLNPLDTDLVITDSALFDDQNTGAPRLYISAQLMRAAVAQPGSTFRRAGGAWEPVAGGPGPAILCIQREAGREGLYAAEQRGYATSITRYDGSSWSPLPPVPHLVTSLASFDPDGAGPQPPRLYAAAFVGEYPNHISNEYGLVYSYDGSGWPTV